MGSRRRLSPRCVPPPPPEGGAHEHAQPFVTDRPQGLRSTVGGSVVHDQAADSLLYVWPRTESTDWVTSSRRLYVGIMVVTSPPTAPVPSLPGAAP